jgi:hypothetical protein
MERIIDEVLDNLVVLPSLTDSEQVANELKQILLDPSISEGDKGNIFGIMLFVLLFRYLYFSPDLTALSYTILT